MKVRSVSVTASRSAPPINKPEIRGLGTTSFLLSSGTCVLRVTIATVRGKVGHIFSSLIRLLRPEGDGSWLVDDHLQRLVGTK